MTSARRIAQPANNALALLLAIALLFAQWAGLQHRIVHAGWQYQPHASSAADDNGKPGKHHSCVEFDAATVADTIHIAPFVAPLLTGARILASWAAFISWDAPPVRHFSSRAPPFA